MTPLTCVEQEMEEESHLVVRDIQTKVNQSNKD